MRQRQPLIWLLIATANSCSRARRWASCSAVGPNGCHPAELYQSATAELVRSSYTPSTGPGSNPNRFKCVLQLTDIVARQTGGQIAIGRSVTLKDEYRTP